MQLGFFIKEKEISFSFYQATSLIFFLGYG